MISYVVHDVKFIYRYDKVRVSEKSQTLCSYLWTRSKEYHTYVDHLNGDRRKIVRWIKLGAGLDFPEIVSEFPKR